MITIHEIPLPDAPEGLWLELHRITSVCDAEMIGGNQWWTSPEASLRAAKADTENDIRRFLATVDGVAAGSASIRSNRVDSPNQAHVYIQVLPEFRGRGIAQALADHVRSEAPYFEVYSGWSLMPPPGEHNRLKPPSGSGAVPSDHPATKLALRNGMTLGIVERVSRYDFDAPLIDPVVALKEAQAVAGADYEVVAWEGVADEPMLAGLAKLRELMYSDTPNGDLTVVQSSWDVDRLRRIEEERVLTFRYFRTAIRHVPSGDIVAVNELMVDRSNPEAFVDQWDTVVARDHRGHRLGMAVKAANLIQVREAVPTATSIVTWNAEENRHMLAVNEALGFYPILVEGGFELKRS